MKNNNTLLNKSKDLRKLPTKILSVAQEALTLIGSDKVHVRYLKHFDTYCIELPMWYRMVANKGSNSWLILSHEEYSKRFSMATGHRGTKSNK